MDVFSMRPLTLEEMDAVSGGGIPVPAPRPSAPDCTCGPTPTPTPVPKGCKMYE